MSYGFEKTSGNADLKFKQNDLCHVLFLLYSESLNSTFSFADLNLQVKENITSSYFESCLFEVKFYVKWDVIDLLSQVKICKGTNNFASKLEWENHVHIWKSFF